MRVTIKWKCCFPAEAEMVSHFFAFKLKDLWLTKCSVVGGTQKIKLDVEEETT